MVMAMCAALYTMSTGLAELLPREHETCCFPLALQPATRAIEKRSDNVKRRDKAVQQEYWKGLGKKISEAIIKR